MHYSALRINVASQEREMRERERHCYFINSLPFGEIRENVDKILLQIFGRTRKDAGKICGWCGSVYYFSLSLSLSLPLHLYKLRIYLLP